MTIDERSRHRLYRKLEEVLGAEEATVLMEHLPPVGWADVATKRDLEIVRQQVDAKLEHLRETDRLEHDRLRTEIQASAFELRAEFRESFDRHTKQVVTWMIATNGLSALTVGALAFAAARLL